MSNADADANADAGVTAIALPVLSYRRAKKDHYTLLHKQYESSGLCGFGEVDFFYVFSHCMSFGANDPRGGAIFDPRGTVGRFYKGDHYTLLHTKYESLGPCGFGEEDFFMFFPLKVYGSYLLPWKPEF